MTDVQADLAHARAAIDAAAPDPGGPTDLTGPHGVVRLAAATPLTPLPSPIVAVIVNRARLDLAPLGTQYPRSSTWRRTVVPAAGLAVVDLVALVVAVAAGRPLFAVLAAILLVLLTLIGAGAARFALQDPLRVTASQRGHIDASKRWASQPWDGPLATRPERNTVVAACHEVGRISASEAWTWASIAEQRSRLDLSAILDAVDEQARGAAAGASHSLGIAAVLRCYADRLDLLVQRASRTTSEPDVRTELPSHVAGELAELLDLLRHAQPDRR